MASLSSYYSTQGNAVGDIMNADQQGSDARTDAGLQQSRLLSRFSQRTLPDMRDRFASRGTLYGGQFGVQGDRAKEDTANQYGDVQRMLDRQLANLRRQGIMAATGVML